MYALTNHVTLAAGVAEVNRIESEILRHIESEGSAYHRWYVGITADAKSRLFGDHQVKEWYIWRWTSSSVIARTVEKNLLAMGCDGGPGGGDNTACVVYAYKKTLMTDP